MMVILLAQANFYLYKAVGEPWIDAWIERVTQEPDYMNRQLNRVEHFVPCAQQAFNPGIGVFVVSAECGALLARKRK
jgi:hypothetical protein